MSVTTWLKGVEEVRNHIFRISTPGGSGTGFLLCFPGDGKYCGIATAGHVISEAVQWEHPIRITHHTTKTSYLFHRDEQSGIAILEDQDLAFIVVDRSPYDLPEEPLPLPASGKELKQGVQIGWCGFPSVAPPGELCFFTGYVSCLIKDRGFYLVDGVAINGVSGAPSFVPYGGTYYLAGLVRAYAPNRATGEALPGMCIVQSVTPFHELLKEIREPSEAQEAIHDGGGKRV